MESHHMTFNFLKHLLSGQTISADVPVNNGLVCGVFKCVRDHKSIELKQVTVFFGCEVHSPALLSRAW